LAGNSVVVIGSKSGACLGPIVLPTQARPALFYMQMRITAIKLVEMPLWLTKKHGMRIVFNLIEKKRGLNGQN
jgi:hypothetical protein